MLILSRKSGERICIGEEVEIVVLNVHGGRVRIGIVAPKHIPVHRQEIYERIKRGEATRDADDTVEGH